MTYSRTTRALCFLGLLTAFALSACGEYDSSGSRYYPGPSAPPANAGIAPDEGVEDPDRFDAVGTNPFVLAGSDPFSTFASDVDTASYDLFMANARTGIAPPAASVRLEEYVNAFEYDYGAPEAGAEVPFAIDLEASAHPMGRELVQMRVGIQASTPTEFRKLPTNLVFLVDVSGSMSSPEKLPYAQALIRASLDSLEQNDTVSIVTYAGSTRVALPPTAAFEREAIERVVRGLNADGGTAGGAGIQLAYDQAEAGFLEGGFNQVVLCTDGDFNIGISDPDALVDLIEEERETGVYLTAIGFGTPNNDAMMERVSNAGNGFYSIITSPEHAQRYAEEQLLRTVEVVAKDLKFQIEFNPAEVLAYRLVGFENRALADDDFRDDAVDAGEIGAGHRVTALYELVLVDGTIPTPEGAPEPSEGEESELEPSIDVSLLAEVRVRWKDRDASAEDDAYEVRATLSPDEIGESADADSEWAWTVAALAEILKGSPYADRTEYETIDAVVEAQATRDDERTRFAEAYEMLRRAL